MCHPYARIASAAIALSLIAHAATGEESLRIPNWVAGYEQSTISEEPVVSGVPGIDLAAFDAPMPVDPQSLGTPLRVRRSATSCPPAGLIASVDWINWKPRRRGMDFASFLNPVWLTPVVTESLSFDRDDGVRIGLGYRFASRWDLSWNYTYLHTDDARGVTSTDYPGTELLATRSFIDTTFSTVWADARLDYDVNDLEAGRWLSLTDTAAMRIFAGFRWAIIDQEFNLAHSYRDAFNQSVTGRIENPTRLDGYGIRVGAEGRWKSCAGLSLFARGAGSVLVGRFNTMQREVDQSEGTIINFSETYTQAVPVIEVAAGAAWQRGNWEIAGGYELATWFNMAEVGRTSYDLILDGFFARASYGY